MSPSLSTGVDLVSVPRIQDAMTRYGERFLRRIYTPAERSHCAGRGPQLAARFAAKEAVAKALGTGLGAISWLEIEILPDPLGKPLVHLHGNARQHADALGLTEIAISLSHEKDLAIAFVVAL